MAFKQLLIHKDERTLDNPLLAPLPQDVFDEMEGSGLQSIIERCESSLALLKMRLE